MYKLFNDSKKNPSILFLVEDENVLKRVIPILNEVISFRGITSFVSYFVTSTTNEWRGYRRIGGRREGGREGGLA